MHFSRLENGRDQPWFFKSKLRLFSTLFLVLALPTALFLLFISLVLRDRAFQGLTSDAKLLATVISLQIEEEFLGLRTHVESFAHRPSLEAAARSSQQSLVEGFVREMVEQNPKIHRGFVTDAAGVLVCAYPPDPAAQGADFSDHAWFQDTLRSIEPQVSEVSERPGSEKVVTIACRIRILQDDAGATAGILAAEYLVSDLSERLERVTPRELGFVAVADGAMNVVHDKFEILNQPGIAPLPCFQTGAKAGIRPADASSRIRVPALQTDYYATCMKTGPLGWTLAVATPVAAAYRPLNQIQSASVLIFAVSILLVMGIGWSWFRTVYAYAEGLRKRTAELEHFCYNIAHNFRSPLRSMEGFASILIEEAQTESAPAVLQYAERIKAAAVQMDSLVQDLLLYGRTTHMDLKVQSLRLDESIHTVLESLSSDLQSRGAQVNVSVDSSRVTADRAILERIIAELVTNALKFSRPGVPAQVWITSEPHGRFLRLWVKDNGIGIAPQFHKEIFGVFNRLSIDQQIAGTGIGLAIVAKGVERMGGHAGLVSQEREGSAFWIDLPKA